MSGGLVQNLQVAALEAEALRAAEGVARDDAAELRAAVREYFKAVNDYEQFRSEEGDGPYDANDQADRFTEISFALAEAELRLKTLAASEGQS